MQNKYNRDKFKQQLQDGITPYKLAKIYGVSQTHIARIMKQFKLELRTTTVLVDHLEGDSTPQEDPIKQKVNEALNISNEIPIDLEKIATHFGYKIKDLDFDEDDVSGMLIKNTIYTNSSEKNKYPTRHRFTIAHELGHALIHKSQNHHYKPVRFRSDIISLDEKKLEQEANKFAAWLLMPEEELLKELNNRESISEDEIKVLANKFNVSFSAMNYRLSDLGYF